jgi:hypothetical protein
MLPFGEHPPRSLKKPHASPGYPLRSVAIVVVKKTTIVPLPTHPLLAQAEEPRWFHELILPGD